MWHELNWCAPAAFVVVAYPILYTAVGAAARWVRRCSGGSSAALLVRLQFCKAEPSGHARGAATKPHWARECQAALDTGAGRAAGMAFPAAGKCCRWWWSRRWWFELLAGLAAASGPRRVFVPTGDSEISAAPDFRTKGKWDAAEITSVLSSVRGRARACQ